MTPPLARTMQVIAAMGGSSGFPGSVARTATVTLTSIILTIVAPAFTFTL